MRNILILAGVAGLAAAVAMYFVNEADKDEADYLADAADDALDEMNRSLGAVEQRTRKSFHAMG